MFNPFAEVAEADPPDADLVAEAQHGNRVALEKLVLRHQAWIYNIAVRIALPNGKYKCAFDEARIAVYC